jgi:outer membrane protein OmpA-like peptidoglycan-associated protein
LEEWFEKTPVVIRQLGDSMLQLSVPMANSFEPGQSQPRPALVAVLDRLAESLRRQANTRLTVITAGDTASPAALAAARGQKVVDHLVSRRIAPQRMTTQRADAPGTPVLLQMQFGVLPVL